MPIKRVLDKEIKLLVEVRVDVEDLPYIGEIIEQLRGAADAAIVDIEIINKKNSE